MNGNQEVSNTNHFGSVSDSLDRLAVNAWLVSWNVVHELCLAGVLCEIVSSASLWRIVFVTVPFVLTASPNHLSVQVVMSFKCHTSEYAPQLSCLFLKPCAHTDDWASWRANSTVVTAPHTLSWLNQLYNCNVTYPDYLTLSTQQLSIASLDRCNSITMLPHLPVVISSTVQARRCSQLILQLFGLNVPPFCGCCDLPRPPTGCPILL